MNFKPNFICCFSYVFIAAAALWPTTSSAQTRHSEAHVHGVGKLLVVIDKTRVSLALAIPAADIVGFERDPANQAERDSVQDAIDRLTEPLNLFVFSSAPDCAVITSEAQFGDDHDEGHEEEHSEGLDHDEHLEFTASYLLDCPDLSGAELVLETRLFETFGSTETLAVEGLVNGSAVQAELSRQEPAVALR